MLSVRDVRSGYGKKEILHGVSLDVPEGAIVTLLGANGAGKSTLMNTLVGIVPATGGSIEFKGHPLPNKTPDRAARAGVSLVAEKRELFLGMSVADNIRLGGYMRRSQGGSAAAGEFERVLAIFPRLRERLQQPAQTLSGGEQQMLAIARALMSRPSILLLDEPSLGLAPKIIDEIFGVIRGINRQGTSILMVEQNAALALELADFGYVLELGEIKLSGASEELRTSPVVRASYL